jgi:hypothetical protein
MLRGRRYSATLLSFRVANIRITDDRVQKDRSRQLPILHQHLPPRRTPPPPPRPSAKTAPMTPRQQLLNGLAPVSCGRRLHSAASQVGGYVGGRGASAGWSSSAGGAADLQLMAQHRSGVPLLPESAWAKRDASSPRTLPPRKPRRAVQRLPTWFIRIECGRCGKVRVLNEAHTAQRHTLLRGIIAPMRHDGCGGRTGKAMLTLIQPPTE